MTRCRAFDGQSGDWARAQFEADAVSQLHVLALWRRTCLSPGPIPTLPLVRLYTQQLHDSALEPNKVGIAVLVRDHAAGLILTAECAESGASRRSIAPVRDASVRQ